MCILSHFRVPQVPAPAATVLGSLWPRFCAALNGPSGCLCVHFLNDGGDWHGVLVRGLTFELSGRRRQDAGARTEKMYRVPQAGPWWPAVGAPFERGVRHQCSQRAEESEFPCEPLCWLLRATAIAVAVPRVCGACQGHSMALCALRRPPLRSIPGFACLQLLGTPELRWVSTQFLQVPTRLP